MMKFLAQIFQDVDGNYSSKRFMTLIGLLLFVEMVQVNIFWGIVPNQELMALDFTLVLSGMGMIAMEKFTKRGLPISGPTKPSE